MTQARTERPLSAAQRLLAVVMILLLLALSGWAVYDRITSRAEILIWDFHIPWLGIQAMLRDGANPYSEEVTLATEMEMLGRPAREQKYELRLELAYPLYVMALIGPLAILPLPVAQAVWLTLIEAGLLSFILLAPRAVGWRPPAWLLGLTAIFAVGFYSILWAIYLGQISIVVAAFVALSWWGLETKRWTLCGVFLALSTIKPQMVFLFVPGMLAWAAYRRQWRLATSFFVTLILLVLLPTPWLPAWPLAWLKAMQRYTGYTIYESPLSLLLRSPWLVGLAAILLLGWTVYCWWRNPRHEASALGWALSMLLVVSTLIAPRTSHVNQLVLLLPLFFVFSRVSKAGIAVTVEIALLVGLWALDLLLPPSSGLEHMIWQHRVISPILPTGLAVALLYFSPRPARGGT